jgi:hypothetical protein
MSRSGAPCTVAKRNSQVRGLQIPQSISVNRFTRFVLGTTATLLIPAAVSAQAKRYPLDSVEGLRFHNVNAEPAVLQGKKGLRATISEETLRRIERTQVYARLVWIEDLDVSNGVIEAEIAEETPSKYEAYVDLATGTWTKAKIEVRGEQARLYVHANEQPTLIVKDVKSGAKGNWR